MTSSMRHRLINPVSSQLPNPAVEMGDGGSRRRFPRLRGGEGEEALAVPVVCLIVIFVFSIMFIQGLEPNEYGFKMNTMTGSISTDVVRGGIHMVSPMSKFIKYPATQQTIEYSSTSSTRSPIRARAGADPDDATSGGQDIWISCALQYVYIPEQLSKTFQFAGAHEAAMQMYDGWLSNEVRNIASAKFSSKDFFARRSETKDTMLKALNKTLYSQSKQGAVVVNFQFMEIQFSTTFDDKITQTMVAEQNQVVNGYKNKVEGVVQKIAVMQSENEATIANISAGAKADSKEIAAGATKSAFNMKQDKKVEMYTTLKKELNLDDKHMTQYFKIKALQGQATKGKLVVGIPGIGQAAPAVTQH